MINTEKQKLIRKLVKEKKIIILAHWYTNQEVQQVADFVGDSLTLLKKCADTDKTILFCGVNFMAETIKAMFPKLKIIVPDYNATCTLAVESDNTKILKWKESYKNSYLISYINSSLELKKMSDIICTSSNFKTIIENAPTDKTILFAPDKNLGTYANNLIGSDMILWNRTCCVHDNMDHSLLEDWIIKYPDAPILAHPECQMKILNKADLVGSTTAIIDFVTKSKNTEFIIATETGIQWKLKEKFPNKKLMFLTQKGTKNNDSNCVNMKKHNLDKIITAINNQSPEVVIDKALGKAAAIPIKRMLETVK